MRPKAAGLLALCLALTAASPAADGRGGLMQAVADLQAHRYLQAERILAPLVKAYPDSLEAGFYLGQALYYQGRLDEARSRFEGIVAVDPSIPVTYYYLGRIAFDRNDLGAALRHLERADQLDPDLPMVHYYLGLAMDRGGKPSAALAQLDKALALQPDLALAAYARAYVLFHESHQVAAARSALKAASDAQDPALKRKVEALRRRIDTAP